MKKHKNKSANSAVATNRTSADGLRSPRIRMLTDRMPGHLAAWLVALSLLIFACAALAAALLPYPYSGGETILQHMI